MKSINLIESNTVEVIAILVKLQCNSCKSIWGMYLREDGSFPEGWDVCLKCECRKSYFGFVKENVNEDGSRREIFK